MTDVKTEHDKKTEYDKLFIGGRWVEPSTSEVIEVHNPATGEYVGKVPLVKDFGRFLLYDVSRSS